MVSLERHVESNAEATAEDESNELTNSGHVLLELFLSKGLLHLRLVNGTEHLHVGVSLLKLYASQGLSLKLL